jgi:hypothetical protein
MASARPSIGRIVHYVSYGTPGGEYKSECRAAIVTAVDQYQPPKPDDETFIGHVDLAVLNPTGMFFNRGVHHHEGDIGHDDAGVEIEARSYRGGTWHWPERV